MTFMLSNVRNNHEDAEQPCSSGTKRKSLSLLPSSPTKLKRVDRSHSRGSSLSLLSASSLTTSAISRLSSLKYSKRSGQPPSPSSRKSPPVCTISLESVTVNICDEDRNLSKSYTVSPPLEVVDVNVIPFPKASSEESEPQLSSNITTGRRRRSNHLLLGHRRSSSVHSISSQHGKENLDSFAFPSRPPSSSAPKRTKASARNSASINSSSAAKASSYSPKDIRFIALIRRSVMHGIAWRDEMKVGDRMDVDGEFGSGSVTFDILNDEEGDENANPGQERSQDHALHNQDVLLVDRLGKLLSDWGYREREPLVPLSPPPPPLRRPLAPVALSAATVTFDSMPILKPSAMASMVPGTIDLPVLEGHATRTSFFDNLDLQEEIMMDMDVDRPERPISPVARCLEPADENIVPVSKESVEQPERPSIPIFNASSPLDDSAELAISQQHPLIVAPKPIPSPPPVSPFAPGSLSSHQRVLSSSQLVATLMLRHKEKMAARCRGCSQVGNDTTGKGTRRRSPLACEL